jgi:hypothetical protein
VSEVIAVGEPRRERCLEHESTPARRRLWSVRDHQLKQGTSALLYHLRRFDPDAASPASASIQRATAIHDIDAVPIRPFCPGFPRSLPEARTAYQRRHRQRDLSVDLRILQRHRRSRRSGTGLLTYMGGLSTDPYSLFRWSLIALWLSGYVRERRGDLTTRLGRSLVRRALHWRTIVRTETRRASATSEHRPRPATTPCIPISSSAPRHMPPTPSLETAAGHRSRCDGSPGRWFPRSRADVYQSYLEARAGRQWLLVRGYDIRLLVGIPRRA